MDEQVSFATISFQHRTFRRFQTDWAEGVRPGSDPIELFFFSLATAISQNVPMAKLEAATSKHPIQTTQSETDFLIDCHVAYF